MTKRDRDGRELSLSEWADLWSNMSYRVIEETMVAGGLVRTVWEGMDELPSAMFFTGYAAAGEQFVTIAWADTEPQARQLHAQVVEAAREDPGPGLRRRFRTSWAGPNGTSP